MMKNAKKSGFMSLLLAALLLAAACGPSTPPPGPETDTYLVQSGASEYKIVKPLEATEQEALGASELSKLIAESTGCTLPVVTDEGLSFDEANKYVSVGNTAVLAGSGVTLNAEELNGDGFKMVTKGNTVLLAGTGKYAPLYACYEFLKQNFGYGFYALDEIAAPRADSVKLKRFDVTSVPDFFHRNVYFKAIKDNPYARGIFRTYTNPETWGLFGHTYFSLLPPGTYKADHPDWYSSDGNQLCWSSEEARVELVVKLKEKIMETPDCLYYMVGQEDTNAVCKCEKCNAAYIKYGTPSGAMMVWVNKIAEDVEKWQREACPEREVYIGTFAYQQTLHPPVEAGENGDFVPVSPEVVARKNVLVQYAPLGACYSHSLMNEKCNDTFRKDILGWGKLTERFAVWSYSAHFTDYLINFNNFNTLKENYQIYRGMGAVSLMDQGTGETTATPFHDLRVYLQSNLMWDADLDPNELTDDFMRHYYKEAYPEIREYYDLLRAHYASIEADYERVGDGRTFCCYVYKMLGENIVDAKFWPKRFLDQCTSIFERAERKVAELPDGEEKAKLALRVTAESFATRFLLIQLYPSNYTQAELTSMIDAFERDALETGLICCRENTNINVLYNEWRAR